MPFRYSSNRQGRGGRVVRWSWVSFQCRGVLLIWITVGQGPSVLAVGAGGGCMDIFTLIYPFFPLSPSLWETARYRLKYCLKGPLNPKPTKSNRQGHNYLKRYQSYRADTISIGKITKGNNSAKNVGGVTIVNICTLFCHALHFYQVL